MLLGSIIVHGRAGSFFEALKVFMEARLSNPDAELWLVDGKPRYAVISKAKRRGRNPKLKLLDRLDGADGLMLPKEFAIVGRWVECIALSDRKTLLVRGDGLSLAPAVKFAYARQQSKPHF